MAAVKAAVARAVKAVARAVKAAVKASRAAVKDARVAAKAAAIPARAASARHKIEARPFQGGPFLRLFPNQRNPAEDSAGFLLRTILDFK